MIVAKLIQSKYCIQCPCYYRNEMDTETWVNISYGTAFTRLEINAVHIPYPCSVHHKSQKVKNLLVSKQDLERFKLLL